MTVRTSHIRATAGVHQYSTVPIGTADISEPPAADLSSETECRQIRNFRQIECGFPML